MTDALDIVIRKIGEVHKIIDKDCSTEPVPVQNESSILEIESRYDLTWYMLDKVIIDERMINYYPDEVMKLVFQHQRVKRGIEGLYKDGSEGPLRALGEDMAEMLKVVEVLKKNY